MSDANDAKADRVFADFLGREHACGRECGAIMLGESECRRPARFVCLDGFFTAACAEHMQYFAKVIERMCGRPLVFRILWIPAEVSRG